MKSLDQIASQGIPLNSTNTLGDASNHFIISQSGSYYLTGNLAVTEANAIRVSAAGVTIDLNGFEISHTGGTGSDGITILTTAHRCTVKNGSINAFNDGVDTITTTARGCLFRDLSATASTGIAIRVGQGAVLDNCRVHDCSGLAGIATGNGATLVNCTASNNSAMNAIQTGNGCALTNCTASGNTGTNGITTGIGCSLNNCAAISNTISGVAINTLDGCSLTNCSAASNTATAAIATTNNCSLNNCSANSNAAVSGIAAGFGNSLVNCSAGNNTSTAGMSVGISASFNSSITNCTCFNNTTPASPTNSTAMGFNLTTDSVIQGCSASNNLGDGIRVGSHCTVLRNMVVANIVGAAGAGIHATAGGNRIEGNNLVINPTGINVEVGGNLVLGNSVSASSVVNYSIAANNRYGPIVNIVGSAPAVNGSSAASTLTSSDPWTNFSY
jgi:hypothetical protein